MRVQGGIYHIGQDRMRDSEKKRVLATGIEKPENINEMDFSDVLKKELSKK